jgi:hypothetical protein
MVARGRSDTGRGLGGLKSTGSETLQLIIDYVKQETLDPLKGLGRYIVFGVAGSVALAIGLVVLAVSLLRLLQGETDGAFDGNWSWVPYLICTVVVVAVAAVAVWAIAKGRHPSATSPDKEAP